MEKALTATLLAFGLLTVPVIAAVPGIAVAAWAHRDNSVRGIALEWAGVLFALGCWAGALAVGLAQQI